MKAGWYKYDTSKPHTAYQFADTMKTCIDMCSIQYEAIDVIVVSDTEVIAVTQDEKWVIKWLPEGHPDAKDLLFDSDVWIPVRIPYQRMPYQAVARKAFAIEPMQSFTQPLYYLGEGVE